MAQVAGITVERNLKGVPTYARINLRKFETELNPFFQKYGLDLYSYNRDRRKKRKEKDVNPATIGVPPCGYVTLEQFAEDTKAIINDYCDLYDIH